VIIIPLLNHPDPIEPVNEFDCDEFFILIDVFMERYKMSFDEVMQMPIPVFESLKKAIEDRSRLEEKEYKKRSKA